jgi:5-methylcytosine-specific restriction endonuclease McrA
MGRCLRSRKLRRLLWAASGGKCSMCGKDLTEHDLQADHIKPWCKTKRTNVCEMQALCRECNAKKGSKDV